MSNQKKYVALLRGINVGGHKKVPMKELKKLLEAHAYKNVQTILNTGNVVFETTEAKSHQCQNIIEEHFGFEVSTMIISHDQVVKIVKSDPFKKTAQLPNNQYYVTFSKTIASNVEIPHSSDDGSFTIVAASKNIILSYIDKNKIKTTEYMKILEKKFGKNITTRNFNTVKKIAQR